MTEKETDEARQGRPREGLRKHHASCCPLSQPPLNKGVNMQVFSRNLSATPWTSPPQVFCFLCQTCSSTFKYKVEQEGKKP